MMSFMHRSAPHEAEGWSERRPAASSSASKPEASAGLGYGAAVVGPGAAALLRWGLSVLLGQAMHPFIVFYPVVIFAALLGGIGPGLLATALSALMTAILFLPPVHSLSISNPADLVAWILFCGINLSISVVAGALRSARARAMAEAGRAALSEQRFRLFLEQTPTPVWIKDEEGRYEFLNPAYERRFRVSLAKAQGKRDEELWPAATAARLREADRQALAAGHPIEVTEATTEADGATSIWHNTKFAFADPTGQRFVASLGLDITERQQAEEKLRQSEEKFRAVFEQAAIGIGRVRFDDARWLDVNESFCQMLGYTSEFMRATPWPQMTHPEDVDLDLIPFRRMASGELDSYSVEKRFVHADGHAVWTRLTLSLVRDAAGRPDYEIAIIENIDRHKQAEEALVRERAFLEAVLQACPAGIIVAEPGGKLIRMNPANQRLWGLAPFSQCVEEYREWKGWWADGTDRNGRRLAPQEWAISRALRGEVCAGDIVEIESFDDPGAHHIIVNSAAPVRGPGGEILGAVIVQVDITSLKRTEAALRQSEGRLRVFFESDMFGALLWTARGDITEANAKFLHMLGYSREELQGGPLRWRDITPPEYRQADEASLAEIRERGANTTYEKEFVRKDGSRIAVILGAAAFDERREQGVAFVLDNTERKRAEQALQRRNQHLQLLHQASARLLIGQQPVGLLRQLHRRMAEVFGVDVYMLYQAGAGSGPDPEGLQLVACAGVSPEQQAKLEALRHGRAVCAKPAEALQPVIATRLQTSEAPNCRLVRELGFRSYLFYPLILNNRLHGTVAFASHSREDYDRAELDFFHTIAGTLAEALERARLETELQRHASRLEELVQERTAKLRELVAELEHFSYTITHDMRAPLRAMRGLSGLLLEEAGTCLEGERREYLQRIAEAADRMDRLITDALQYSTLVRGEFQLQPVDAGALLRGMLATYPEFQAPQARIRVEGLLPVVLANEAGLTQCFSNLLGNAVKFVHPGQVPEVRVWAERVPSREPAARAGGAAGPPGGEPPTLSGWHISEQTSSATLPAHLQGAPRVRLWFEDRGIGIQKEYQDKIWVMFQRLNKSYAGTGIGLALVRKAVERMGGRVGLESEPGQGSRFWVELLLAGS